MKHVVRTVIAASLAALAMQPAMVDGEKSAATLDWAPLPVAMTRQLIKQLSTVTVAER